MDGLEELEHTPNRGKDYVQFYKRPKQDDEATLKEGRPIFKMVEYVRITIPGDKNNQVDRPMRATDIQKYGPQYQAFQADKSQDEASGTLLSAWGGIPPERVEEYSYNKVKTVEQLAGMSDGNLQRMGPGAHADRTRARDYVETAKGHAPVAQLRKELEDRDVRIVMLEKALKDLGDRFEASQKQTQPAPNRKQEART